MGKENVSLISVLFMVYYELVNIAYANYFLLWFDMMLFPVEKLIFRTLECFWLLYVLLLVIVMHCLYC